MKFLGKFLPVAALVAQTVFVAHAEFDISAFAPEGGLALGANYWGSKSATRMWQDWDPDSLAKDLDVLKAHGFTYLRVFPRWDVFQPIWEAHTPNQQTYETYLTQDELPRPETPAGYAGVDERMMERFEAFCDLCAKRDMKLIVCLMTGQMTFRIFTPQALERRDLYTDPVALKWERRLLDYFVTRMRHHRAIAAWESGNETCCLGPIASPDAVEAWLALIHGTIRLADPTRPVIGPNTINITDGAWRIDRIAPLSDVLTVHPYNMWTKAFLDDGNGIRNAFFAPSCNVALEQIGGKPAFVEEHGIRRAECTSKANTALYARGLCWNLWSSGCRGLGWWCAFDQDNQMIPPYDWKEPYLELGAFKSDRTPYPVAKTLGSFMSFLDGLPFRKLPAAKTDCVIIVRDGEMVNSTYVLARQAGLQPRFADPTKKLPDASVYFLPNAKGRAFLTLRRWEELKARVREGGATLAISWNDTFLSDHEAVFGAEIESRTPGKPVFRPITAEVLEKDGEGRPYLMRNRYGKGVVYLLARPLALAANARVGGFDSNSWRYYAKVCPKKLMVEDGVRDVTVSEHPFGETRVGVILVNNSTTPYAAKPTVAEGWRVVSAHTDDPVAAEWKDGALRLAGNAGILLMLEKSAK
ncbi:MAG: hypothetical protein MJ240_11585 [Kiritimatiellae bacterium]|nr:hypothetical protein [Kiritimatiellia bacterium]